MCVLMPSYERILNSEFEVIAIFELILDLCRVHETGILQKFYFARKDTSML